MHLASEFEGSIAGTLSRVAPRARVAPVSAAAHRPREVLWRGVVFLTLAIAATTLPREAAGRARGSSGGSSSTGGSFEDQHLLTVGAGIASPSSTSALGENPAGLVFNTSSKLLGMLASGNRSFNPLGYGGAFFSGNGSVGGGLGVQGFNNLQAANANLLLLNWGLAANVESLDVAFGASGTHTLQNNGSVYANGTTGAWGVDLGALFNPHGSQRVGVTAFQVLDGIGAIGVGYADDVSSSATLVIDGVYTRVSQSLAAKPGLKIHAGAFALSASYGFGVTGGGFSWLREGFSLGAGVGLGPNIQLQLNYNQLAEYEAGLTFRL